MRKGARNSKWMEDNDGKFVPFLNARAHTRAYFREAGSSR